MKVEYWKQDDTAPGGFAEQGTWSLDNWAAGHEITARELEQIISHLKSSGLYIGGDRLSGFFKLTLEGWACRPEMGRNSADRQTQ